MIDKNHVEWWMSLGDSCDGSSSVPPARTALRSPLRKEVEPVNRRNTAPKRYWTKERCIAEAAKHQSARAWELASPGSFKAARRNGWKGVCTSHMKRLDRIGITYRDVVYPSISECLIALGYAATARDASKRLLGNLSKGVKKRGTSYEFEIEVFDFEIVRDTRSSEEKAAAKLISIRRGREQAKATHRQQRLSYTKVAPCKCCGRYFNRGFNGTKGLCSDECRDQHITARKKKERRKAKVEGKIPRAGLRRRHRFYGGVWEKGITAENVAKRDGMRCQMCGCKVDRHKGKGWQPTGWSIGHIVPISDGGNTTWDNVRCECISCNTRKGVRIEDRGGQLALALVVKR